MLAHVHVWHKRRITQNVEVGEFNDRRRRKARSGGSINNQAPHNFQPHPIPEPLSSAAPPYQMVSRKTIGLR